jgi:hypothetical protein
MIVLGLSHLAATRAALTGREGVAAMERDGLDHSGACAAFALAFLLLAAGATFLWLRSENGDGPSLMVMAALAGVVLAYALTSLTAHLIESGPPRHQEDRPRRLD